MLRERNSGSVQIQMEAYMTRIQRAFCSLLSVFFFTPAYAQNSVTNSDQKLDQAFWKCEQTDSKTGPYESVSLVPVGSVLMTLVFTYKPGSDAPSNLPAVSETLVSDLHCQFHLGDAPGIVEV